MRTAVFAAVAVAATATAADPPAALPIPAKTVKLDRPGVKLKDALAAVGKQAGLPVGFPAAAGEQNCDAVFNGVPFWDALELLADQTGTRVSTAGEGRRVELVPRGKSREVSSVRGPFRVVARQVTARYLLDEGTTAYDLHLDLHWEPRFPVFRVDAIPAITKATDDRGTKLVPPAPTARAQPAGAVHTAVVRLGELTREARRVGVVEGHFTVTASPKMLTFRFPDPAGKGAPPAAQEGVSAKLTRFESDEGTWEAGIELTYPPTLPEFESFEAWTAGNRVRLVSPAGKEFAPDSYTSTALGPKVVGSYYFKEDATKGLANLGGKGWSVVYEAPATPVEFQVPFTLKDIPLP